MMPVLTTDLEDLYEAIAAGVPPHGSTHKSGGADALKLDELAAPTDVSTLNASTSKHGLMPKLPDAGVVPMRVYYSGTTYEAQTGAIARFTAYTTLHAGFYRASVYLVDRVNTVGGTVTTRLYYTDKSGAQGPVAIATTVLNGVGVAPLSSPAGFYATAGSIIEFDNTLGLFAGTYDCYLVIEAL